MSERRAAILRVLGIGLSWGSVWLVLSSMVGTVIGVVDPDSIDPGEGGMFVLIFGPMGLLSGIVLGILLSLRGRGRELSDLPLLRATMWGVVASAIGQIFYLNHGDQGLLANIQLALVFAAFGGVVTTIWFFLMGWWSKERALPSSRA